MYLLFEGIDTCGKTTQLEKLKDLYPEAIYTKEPGGTPFGIQAREILLSDKLASKRAELLLFLADRAEHYAQVIQPNQDKLILSDRGFLSGIGYALANDDFEFNHLVELNQFALENQFPDLIVLFMTNLETVEARLRSRNEVADGIELRGLEYLISVQGHMKESLEKLSIPYLLIDATQSIEEIHSQIIEKINILG